MMSDKPVIFISHSSKDSELAEAFKQQIINGLGIDDPTDVFVSSNPDGIDCGTDWFSKVVAELERANALVVLLTPNSVASNWVWFEIGYFWPKQFVYPLYTTEIEIPHPLSEKQCKLLSDEKAIINFFTSLAKQFDRELKNIELDDIVAKLDDHVTNLAEEDIKTIIGDYIQHEYKNGTWVKFAELDTYLKLPKGSVATFIKEIATKHNYAVAAESAFGIKFLGTISFGNLSDLIDYRG